MYRLLPIYRQQQIYIYIHIQAYIQAIAQIYIGIHIWIGIYIYRYRCIYRCIYIYMDIHKQSSSTQRHIDSIHRSTYIYYRQRQIQEQGQVYIQMNMYRCVYLSVHNMRQSFFRNITFPLKQSTGEDKTASPHLLA